MVLVLAVITNIFHGKCSSRSKSDRHRIAIETDFPVPLRKFINAARERANLELWRFGTQGTAWPTDLDPDAGGPWRVLGVISVHTGTDVRAGECLVC